MTILDSFVFLLTANEQDAVEGITDTGEAFDELKKKGKKAGDEVANEVEGLGSKVKTQANKIHEALSNAFDGIADKAGANFNLASSLTAIGAAVGGALVAGLSLNAVLEKQESILQRVNDAATLGVDISQYDSLGKAFEANGLDADGFRDSLFDLNEALGEAASDAKSGKAESFKTFGVTLKTEKGEIKGADEALLELAGSMEKMSKQEAIFQIKALGITDNKMIDTLLKGRKALEDQIALQKERGVLTQKDADNALEYKHATQELDSAIGSLTDKLGAALLPVMTQVTRGFVAFFDFVTEHKGFVVGALGAIAGVGVMKLIPVIKDLTLAMKFLKIETLLALWPFALIAAAIIACGLIVDDLWNYFSGGESVIGDLAAKFPMLKDALEGLKTMVLSIGEVFNDPKKAFEDFWQFLQLIWTNMCADAKKGIDAMINIAVQGFNNLADGAKGVMTKLWNWIVNLFSNIGSYISDSVSNAASSVVSSTKSFFGLGDDEEPSNTQTPEAQSTRTREAQSTRTREQPQDNAPLLENIAKPAIATNNAIGVASSMPMPGSNSTRVSNTTNTSEVKIDKVEVITQGTDAEGISQGIKSGLDTHLQGTAAHFDDGRSH